MGAFRIGTRLGGGGVGGNDLGPGGHCLALSKEDFSAPGIVAGRGGPGTQYPAQLLPAELFPRAPLAEPQPYRGCNHSVALRRTALCLQIAAFAGEKSRQTRPVEASIQGV